MVRHVANLEEFKKTLEEAGDKLVVVDFTAVWCGPCRRIGPVFDELSTLPVNGNVIFIKVDVDKATDVSQHCDITCMPTFHFYKKKVKVDGFSGADVETLKKKVEAHRT